MNDTDQRRTARRRRVRLWGCSDVRVGSAWVKMVSPRPIGGPKWASMS